jgi:hypothetical protein
MVKKVTTKISVSLQHVAEELSVGVFGPDEFVED